MGHWKNIEDLEENLSMPELELLLDSSREQEWMRQKFAAALKGINLEEGQAKKTAFEEVKIRAAAKSRGVAEEQIHFDIIGIEVEQED